MDVSLGIGIVDFFLFLVLGAHDSPAAPLEVVLSPCLQDLAFAVVAFNIHDDNQLLFGWKREVVYESN